MRDALEGLWRPKVEGLAAVICLLAAAAVLLRPAVFLLSATAAAAIGGGLASLGLWRLWQYLDLSQRQRALHHQPLLRFKPRQIPAARQALYLGLGFRWQRIHAQRLYDARLAAEKLLKPSRLLRWYQRFFPPGDIGGDPWLHGVEIDEQPVTLKLAERAGHTLVVGTTGVGKTRHAEFLIAQDIRRGDNVVIVIDPKGDLSLMQRVCREAKRSGRENELTVFHLGYPEVSARYNPLGDFTRLTEVAGRVAAQLPADGQAAAFQNFAWRYVNIIARAMIALGRRPSYDQIKAAAQNIDALAGAYYRSFLERALPDWQADYRRFEALLEDGRGLPPALKGRDRQVSALMLYVQQRAATDQLPGGKDDIIQALEHVLQTERAYFDRLVASLLPFLEKVTSGRINEILSPDYLDMADRRPVFTWSQVLNRNGIVYIGLDTLSDAEVGAAVGYAMFSDLKSTAGQIYKEGRDIGAPAHLRRSDGAIIVHADEMAEIVGSELTGLLNKGRGAGFQLNLYTQTVDDAEVRLGSAAAARQQLGNLNNLIMLRVRDSKTAELLTSTLDEVEIASITMSSAASGRGDGDFNVRNEDKITLRRSPLLAAAELLKLPKGHAFALINGGQLYKIRLPLIDESDTAPMGEDARRLIAQANQLPGG